MTEPENFFERWSRRKRQVAEEPGAASEPEPEKTEETAAPAPTPPTVEPPEAFDLSKLPPVESISAETDVRGFLQQGVPPDLTRAALRRAWSSDPAIRDFVGPVENGWDFNDPNAMPGFGPIASDEVARLVKQMFGAADGVAKDAPAQKPQESSPTPATETSAPAPPENASKDTSDISKDSSVLSQRTKDVASQEKPDA